MQLKEDCFIKKKMTERSKIADQLESYMVFQNSINCSYINVWSDLKPMFLFILLQLSTVMF